jgi:hypothetical protein
MSEQVIHPTPFPEVNRFLQILQARMTATLGDHLVGLYLDGSLARGGFDSASDIDFVAVTDVAVSEPMFLALQSMHDQIARLGSIFAEQVEGFYVSKDALRRYDPQYAQFPNIERGHGERLKWVEQGQYWIIHRYILREYGVVVTGPPPANLIDPVSADDLHRTVGKILDEWSEYIAGQPALLTQKGYQSYAVLSLCRMLYTLENGDITSKEEAAAWAQRELGERWRLLIEKARVDRLGPEGTATPAGVAATLAFLEYAKTYERNYWASGAPWEPEG